MYEPHRSPLRFLVVLTAAAGAALCGIASMLVPLWPDAPWTPIILAGTMLIVLAGLVASADDVFAYFRRSRPKLALELAIGGTVVAGVVGLFLEVQERDRARIIAAWQIVAAQPAAEGNVGEKAALELLVRRGERLDGLHLRLPNLRESDLTGAALARARIVSDFDPETETGRRANLHFARLSGADLSRADLSGADLRVANLRVADLSGANLAGADLRVANLTGDILSDANLSDAKLGGANLRFTDLTRANLADADLTNADLIDADFARANLYRTNLSGADLISARNLTQDQLDDAFHLRFMGPPKLPDGFRPPPIRE